MARRLAPTLLALALTLALALVLGEVLLRLVNGWLDGIVDRLGWGWARLAVVVLWAVGAGDRLHRSRVYVRPRR